MVAENADLGWLIWVRVDFSRILKEKTDFGGCLQTKHILIGILGELKFQKEKERSLVYPR